MPSFHGIDRQTDYTPEQAHIKHQTQTPPSTTNDVPFTRQELTHIIQHIRTRITPGTDNITSSFVKNIFKFPSLILNIYNACLMYSYYPKQWKESRVILIPKPNKPLHLPSSYRPICVNSILGKVLEKLVCNRLYHFLHTNHLHPKQFGFTHKALATAALVQIKNTLLTEIEAQNKPIIISIDITNVFNTLQTPFVLEYFKRHNIPRNLYLLLQTILTDCTIIYPTHSTPVSLHAPLGSPQGSPLSPLLWNVMISSLLDLSYPANIHIQAFADDITCSYIR